MLLQDGPALKDKPNISGLEEFLLHGLKYAFPAKHGEVTRGVRTSYAAEPLRSEILLSKDLPPVWLWHDGDTRGVGCAPLQQDRRARGSTRFGMATRASEIWRNAIWCTDCGRCMENPNCQLLVHSWALMRQENFLVLQ
jgi:hypothetical protein